MGAAMTAGCDVEIGDYPRARFLHGTARQEGATILRPGASAGVVVEEPSEISVPSSERNVLVMALSDKRRLESDLLGSRQQVRLAAGAFVVIPPGQPTWWRTPDGRSRLLHVHLDPAFLEALGDGAAGAFRRPVLGARNELAEPLGWALAAAVRTPAAQSGLFVDHVLQALALAALREDGWPAAAALRRARGGLAPWQVKRVTDHLMAHLSEDVSLGDLAALVGLSPYHFCRAFSAATGMPPHRWRLERRMERVRDLLVSTDLSVTQVAAMVGYDDSGRLAAAFRKSTGVTPTEFRRERLE
jgi:AraC family transcriptional regulator